LTRASAPLTGGQVGQGPTADAEHEQRDSPPNGAKTLNVDGHRYWTMGEPVPQTNIINRTTVEMTWYPPPKDEPEDE
jgi:hypothetical protein